MQWSRRDDAIACAAAAHRSASREWRSAGSAACDTLFASDPQLPSTPLSPVATPICVTPTALLLLYHYCFTVLIIQQSHTFYVTCATILSNGCSGLNCCDTVPLNGHVIIIMRWTTEPLSRLIHRSTLCGALGIASASPRQMNCELYLNKHPISQVFKLPTLFPEILRAYSDYRSRMSAKRGNGAQSGAFPTSAHSGSGADSVAPVLSSAPLASLEGGSAASPAQDFTQAILNEQSEDALNERNPFLVATPQKQQPPRSAKKQASTSSAAKSTSKSAKPATKDVIASAVATAVRGGLTSF
jgi:hypothetical protein